MSNTFLQDGVAMVALQQVTKHNPFQQLDKQKGRGNSRPLPFLCVDLGLLNQSLFFDGDERPSVPVYNVQSFI